MLFAPHTALVALLAVNTVTASSWFGNTVYNKWHETELERWLSDNNVPYPTPADRKNLENLVKQNWNSYVVEPYNNWDVNQLQKYIAATGNQVKEGTENSKNQLLDQVKAGWADTSDRANDAYGSMKTWMFDSWTDSQLKSFCDYHGISTPQPRTRDSLLKSARENYQATADKLGETAAYPGDWIFKTWSDSDLKSWLDERGIPVYQGSSRNELIAAVRRNLRNASLGLSAWSATVAANAHAATQGVSNAILDTWSDSQLKNWADKRGIKVPQGSKRNELLALVRRENARLNAQASRVSASAASAYGAATSSAGNEFSRATDAANSQLDGFQNAVYSYINWAREQIGLAHATAQSAASSASGRAAASSSSASKSLSSVSKSAASAASSASKAAEDYAKSEL